MYVTKAKEVEKKIKEIKRGLMHVTKEKHVKQKKQGEKWCTYKIRFNLKDKSNL